VGKGIEPFSPPASWQHPCRPGLLSAAKGKQENFILFRAAQAQASSKQQARTTALPSLELERAYGGIYAKFDFDFDLDLDLEPGAAAGKCLPVDRSVYCVSPAW